MELRRLNLKRKHQPGDACECAECKGRLWVYTTRPKPAEGVRVQYMACFLCKWKPEDSKRVVPLKSSYVQDQIDEIS